MDNVAVVGVVEGQEGSHEHAAVVGGAGDEVGEAGGLGEGGGGDWVEV